VLLSPEPVWSQGAALVAGTVVDASGQPLPGVSVNLSSPSEVRGGITTTTNSDGYYRAAGLSPGTWKVEFRVQGFSPLTYTDILLGIGAELTLDVEMQVGSSEVVTVVAQPPAIETTKSSVGETLPKEYLEEMPVQDGEVFDLLPLAAGVHKRFDTGQIAGLGERSRGMNVIIDGIDNNDNQFQLGQLLVDQYFHDTIQEIEVLSSGYNAEYGDASGVVAKIITKSGSDEFHGRVMYSRRGDALAASPIEGQEPAPLDRNEYGGTLLDSAGFGVEVSYPVRRRARQRSMSSC
jgi:hypothetical protein